MVFAKQEMAEISHLLKYAGKIKLLTKDEERTLVYQFQQASKALDLIVRYRLWMIEPFLLFMYCRERSQSIGKLVGANLRLIIKHAISFQDRGVPLTDLINEGTDGFIHSCELFQLDRNLKLSTYATPWIRQRQGRAIENKSRVVKIPPNKLAQITRLKRLYRKHVERHGEPPSSEELSEYFFLVYKEVITAEECEELGRLQYAHSSLDEAIGEDENISMVAYLADDDRRQPEHIVEKSADREIAEGLLATLSREDADFMMLKYGWVEDQKDRSDKEMANIYKCQVKDIKAREKRIVEQLRQVGEVSRLNGRYMCDVVAESVNGPYVVLSKVTTDKAERMLPSLREEGLVCRIVPHVAG